MFWPFKKLPKKVWKKNIFPNIASKIEKSQKSGFLGNLPGFQLFSILGGKFGKIFFFSTFSGYFLKGKNIFVQVFFDFDTISCTLFRDRTP